MVRKKRSKRIWLPLAAFFMLHSAQAELLTGEARLACEAVLCLSSSERPSECNPALSHYFGIKRYRKGALDWGKTVNARKAFLGLCPASSSTDTGNMPALIHAIAQGAGRCDADFLNQRLRVPKVRRECTLGDGSDRDRCYQVSYYVISDKKPAYCQAYEENGLTALDKTEYVGSPETGGRWVTVNQHEQRH